MSDETTVKQYTIFEVDKINNQLTGFILQAFTKSELKNKLENEDFNTSYFRVSVSNKVFDIFNKEDLHNF